MKINDRKRATGSHDAHEAKKAETPAARETTTGPSAQQQLNKSGFSSAGITPDTTPVPVKNAALVTGSLTLEAIPHDPDVSMSKWVGKHVGDAVANAPAKVGEGQVEKKKLLMCPVLGSLVKEGSLKEDAEGNISLKELNDVMIHRLGITPERSAVTVATGTIGNHFADLGHVLGGKLNLNHLAGSILDHRGHGDTAILQGGEFHEDKFQALIAHSSDGKTMTIEDFGRAIDDQLRRDEGLDTKTRGRSEDLFEMAALINTFGTTDDQGVRRIDFETMRSLYEHQTLPSKETLTARKPTGVLEHLDSMAKMTRR